MREGKIYKIDAAEIHNADGSLAQLEADIIAAESISAQEVKKYASLIAEKLKSLSMWDERTTFLIHALEDSQMTKLLAESNNRLYFEDSLISLKKDLQTAIEPIRNRILKELSYLLDEEEYLFITKTIRQKRWGNIHEVQDAHHTKIQREVTDAHKIDAVALKVLGRLPDHPALIRPEILDANSGTLIVPKIPFITLENIFRNKEWKEQYSFAELLKIVLDTMEGCLFLIKHKLMMQDISPDNIGFRTDTKHGVLFDLEGITRLGVKPTTLLHKSGRVPPEYEVKKRETSEKQMVFEYGTVIEDIWRVKNDSIEDFLKDELQHMVIQMIETDPEYRIDLQSAYTALQSLYNNLLNEKTNTKGPPRLW